MDKKLKDELIKIMGPPVVIRGVKFWQVSRMLKPRHILRMLVPYDSDPFSNPEEMFFYAEIREGFDLDKMIEKEKDLDPIEDEEYDGDNFL